MIRRNGVDWLTISANGAPWGSTINTQHITHVRVQPQTISDLHNGKFEVVISCVDGAQSLIYEKQDDALAAYFRISNELRGSIIDEGKTGG